MYIRLHFIVEGQTEETFVNKTLCPHLAELSISAVARCVMTGRRRGITHRGGISSYARAKRDIRGWMRNDQNPDARFTTMFDLYGLPTDFPGYGDAVQSRDPYNRVKILEDALRDDISDPRGRFIPYFQLHKFEALLLSDPQKLESQFYDHSSEIRRLGEMASKFDSPERINGGNDTAPSKRIIQEIPKYGDMKASAGPIVASRIGLPTLRLKCEHFGRWLGKLEDFRNDR